MTDKAQEVTGMPEIQIRALIDKSAFSKGVQEIETKIAQLNKKSISIQATVGGSAGSFGTDAAKGYSAVTAAQKQYVSGAVQVETAIQKQINALVGLDKETKNAKDSAKAWMLQGQQAYRNVAAEAEAAARTATVAAQQQESALQKQINALTGVSRETKSAKESARAFQMAGKSAFEETLNETEKQNKATKELNNGFKNLGVTIANFAKIKVMQTFTQGIHDAINEMKAMDDELVTIRKVTNATQSELNSLTERAYSVGSAYGVAPSDYLAAVAEFSRAGYGDAAAAMGELAVKTQIVGDVSQDVATQMLLAVDAGYQLGGNVEYLTHVLDGANEIDNNYATSIEKIAEGMGIVAPIAAQAGVSVEELTASLGTITAVTQRSGSETARALRALFLNIMGDTKTEIEDGVTWTVEEVTSVREALAKYAPDVVKAADATKTLINPMEAIGALAQAYQEGVLNQQDLMEIVSDMGGKLRSNQLLALIQNWDMFESMLADVGTSAGSADKEIANALDSWTRKAQILKNTFVELVATGVSTEFVKNILDGATAFLKFEGNLQNILTLAMGLVTIFNGKKISDGIKGIGAALKGTQGSFTAMTSWAGIAMVALSTLNAAVTQHFENLQQSALDSAGAVESIASEYQSLESLVSEYKGLVSSDDYAQDADKQSRVKTIQEEINGLIGEQKTAIDLVNGSLTEQSAILDELLGKYGEQAINDMRAAAIAAENAYLNTFSFLNPSAAKTIDIKVGGDIFNRENANAVREYVETLNSLYVSQAGNLVTKPIKSLEDAQNVLKDAKDLLNFLSQSESLKNTPFFNDVYNFIQEQETLVDSVTQSYETLAKAQLTFEAEQMEGGLTPENIQVAADALRTSDVTWQEHGAILDRVATSLSSVSSAEKEVAEGTTSANAAAYSATGAAKTYAATLKEAKDALDTYKRAQKEVDRQGSISESTMKALLALDADLEDAIRAQTDETGELTGRYVIQNQSLKENTEAAQDNYDAWKDTGNGVDDAADSFETLSEKVLGATDDIKRAREAVEGFKDAMDEPDTGDLFNDYADSVERLYELLGQGKIGTNEFAGLFEMIFGQKKAAELGYDRGLLAQYAEQNRIVTDFFSDEKASAEGLLDTLLSLADAQGNVLDAWGRTVASVKETDGGIEWNISDAEQLAEYLGLSADAVTALVDGLLSMGDGVQYTSEQALSLAQSIEGAVSALEDGTQRVNLSKVAQALLTSGESLESVIKLMQQLKETEGVEVFNEPTLKAMESFIALGKEADDVLIDISSGMAAVGGKNLETPVSGMEALKESAKDAKEEVDNAKSALDKVDGKNATATVDIVQKLSVSGKPVAASGAIAGLLFGTSSVLGSKSEGSKDYAGGPTLLNEKGPEIIAEGGRAYMVGGGAPAIADIPKGATIFNAEDTRKLLTTGIAAKASGTYWRPSSSTQTSGGGSHSSGTSSDSNSAGTSTETPDYWSTVEDYVQYAMDKLKWLIDDADDRIEDVEKQRDEMTDAIDDEIDALEKIEKKIDKQIKEIEKEREAALKPLEEQLEAMRNQKDVQDEMAQHQEKQLAVEEARKALEDAKERTVRVYNNQTGQWEWISDLAAVQEAQKGLEDAEKDLSEYREEMKLNALERQIDQIGDLYDKQIEALEDQNEALQEQTDSLNEKKEELIEQYDAMKEPLEAQKEALQAQYDAFEKQWDAIQLTLSEPAEAVSVALQGLRDTSLPAMSGVIADVTGLLSGLGSALGIAMNGSGLTTPSYSSSGGSGSSFSGSSSGSSSSSKNSSSGKKPSSSKPNSSSIGMIAGIMAGSAAVGAIMGSVFDEGGVATGTGWMQKMVDDDELVLAPDLTKRVLEPKTNDKIQSFTRSLGILVGAAERARDTPQYMGWPTSSSVDSHDTIINGVRIGGDMMQRPLSEVLSALRVYSNNN